MLWPSACCRPRDFAQCGSALLGGRLIGITVLTPFLLVLLHAGAACQPSWEAAGPAGLWSLSALWAVFGFADAFRFQLFYLFFLPVIWTAVRFGLEGVTLGLSLTQIGLIAAIHFTEQTRSDVTSYQALMVVLTFTGLAVGVLVSEQQRTQQQFASIRRRSTAPSGSAPWASSRPRLRTRSTSR